MNDEHLSVFQRFARAVADIVSRAVFFTACVALVIVWIPTILLIPSVDTWQLVINTVTTIITFLLVAVLQNTQRRTEHALQTKLDVLAEGVADLMEHFVSDRPAHEAVTDLRQDIAKLKSAVGLGE
jgi:low affinity Fe/Cu permease